jgi:hypothetical protein
MPQIISKLSFQLHYFVQKDDDKGAHWVVDCLESSRCHDHVIHARGVSCGAFQRLGDVCPKSSTNQDEFSFGELSITLLALNWERMVEEPFLKSFPYGES